jgi:hypothetical protein
MYNAFGDFIDPYRTSPSWSSPSPAGFASTNRYSQLGNVGNVYGNNSSGMDWFDKLKSSIDSDFLMAAAGSIGFNQQSSPGSFAVGSRAPVGAKVGGGDFNAARISDIPGGMYQVEPFAPTYFKKPQGLLG